MGKRVSQRFVTRLCRKTSRVWHRHCIRIFHTKLREIIDARFDTRLRALSSAGSVSVSADSTTGDRSRKTLVAKHISECHRSF